jgi:hypothetical protein
MNVLLLSFGVWDSLFPVLELIGPPKISSFPSEEAWAHYGSLAADSLAAFAAHRRVSVAIVASVAGASVRIAAWPAHRLFVGQPW